MSVLEAKPALTTTTTSTVFDIGKFVNQRIEVKKPEAPKDLFIVSPTKEGNYPVVLFFHGCCISNTSYTSLLQHISSHGFIVIAPGDKKVSSLFSCWCGNQEANSDADVANWLATGLQPVLPDKVIPDLSKVALGGHSRGGKIAFSLALRQAEISQKFLAVFGVDPVAGFSTTNRPDPKILTYIPRSFDLGIPVAIIGTGLGSEKKCLIPPFAPAGTNHAEFFNESNPPIYYFLAKNYGHVDMLDNGIDQCFAKLMCKSGKGSKDLMISGCGGIVVAFVNAKLNGESNDLNAIGDQPSIARIELDPVLFVEVCEKERGRARETSN